MDRVVTRKRLVRSAGVAVAAMALSAPGVSAGSALEVIVVTASATCDGEVTATYSYELFAERSLTSGSIDFTAGATSVKRSLPDIPSELSGPRDISGTEVATGFAVGDVVIVDVRYLDSAEGTVFGLATVEVPECPVTTDAPTTDAPTTEVPVDDTTSVGGTEAPADTEAPTETAPVDDTPVPVAQPSVTLPSTGSGSLPTGVVAGSLLLLGVAMVVFATRRQADGTSR